MGLEESEVPSLRLNIYVKIRKKKRGKGPYPEIVTQLGEITRKNKTFDITDKLKLRLGLTLCQLLCFVRIHGFGGLESWIMRKMSMPHAWKVWAVRLSLRTLAKGEVKAPDKGKVKQYSHSVEHGQVQAMKSVYIDLLLSVALSVSKSPDHTNAEGCYAGNLPRHCSMTHGNGFPGFLRWFT